MKTTENILQQISTRYAIYDRPVNGLRNVLVDSFMPSFYSKSIENIYNEQEKFPNTYAAISEFSADIMGVPVIPREELFRIAGYSLKDIKQLLTAVKAKKHSLCMIGLGGTNSNTLYWLYEMCRETNTPNLFKNLSILENDVLSIDNILRMPMSTLRPINSDISIPIKDSSLIQTIASQIAPKKYSMYKPSIERFTEELQGTSLENIRPKTLSNARSSLNNAGIFNNFTCNRQDVASDNRIRRISKLNLVDSRYDLLAANKLVLSREYYENNNYIYTTSGKYNDLPRDCIFYGAPDITTRERMFVNNKTLITATHGDDDASLMLNPLQDSTLQIESYGVIKLTTFFMNQIALAIGLLKTLSSDIDLTQSNQSLLEYSFPRDRKSLPTKRAWNLQLEHDGLLRT